MPDLRGPGRRAPRSPPSRAWRPADGALSAVQQAFRDCHGLQCGFCTPGFIVSIDRAARASIPDPDDAAIRDGLSGNLCRCTGYQGIIAAVKRRCGRRGRGAAMTAVDEHPPPTPAGNRFVGQRVPAPRGRPLLTGHGTLRRRRRRARDAARRLRAQRHRAPGRITTLDVAAARELPGRRRRVHRRRPERRRARGRGIDFDGPGRRWPPVPRASPTATSASSASPSRSSSPSRRYLAEDACELIELDIEPLDADRRLRRRAGRPTPGSCTPSRGSNVARRHARRRPIPSSTRSSTRRPHVVTETFDQHRYLCVPMETRGMVVDLGRLAQRARRAHVDAERRTRSRGCPGRGSRRAREPVRVVMGDVGGGFGQKMFMIREELAVVLAGKRLGRAGQVDRGPPREPDGRPARPRRAG